MGSIEQAFHTVNRADFLPDEVKGEAPFDVPAPIGFGQTNSQPTVVQLMLEWLEAEPGNKVLDVGSGSGWTAALLAHIVGPKGTVFGVEKIPELVDMARENLLNAEIINAQVFAAGNYLGLPEFAPYDRILVSASASELPQALVDQLAVGGKMVIPVHETVLEVTKQPDRQLQINPHTGFLFVPLVH